MQSTAFFAETLDEIIQAGRSAVPEGSRYREMVEDVLAWHEQNPGDFAAGWQLANDTWAGEHRQCFGPSCLHTLDAKINGAYILLGLLYGNGDYEQTVKLTGRAGQDGDCTANDAASIIGTWLGLSQLEPKFSAALDHLATFNSSSYNFQKVIDSSVTAARAIVQATGGTVSGTGDAEVWSIPESTEIIPAILEQWPSDADAVPPLLTEITATPSGKVVTLSTSATSATGVLGYQWFFGDLSHSAVSTESTIAHTYQSAGTYYVIAYATDTLGNTSWKATTVTVP